MKGILFQIGEPKSIVLLNNGRFDVIDTPPDARVGMLVTIRHSRRRLIVLVIAAAAVALVIGVVLCGLHFGFLGGHELFEHYPFGEGHHH
jgi:hypothetical protein